MMVLDNRGMRKEHTRRTLLRDWFAYLIDIYGSAEKIAERANVSGTTITRFRKDWERASIPSNTTIEKIEQATGEDFASFCLGEDRPRSEFERQVLNEIKSVPPDDRETILRTIRAFSKK